MDRRGALAQAEPLRRDSLRSPVHQADIRDFVRAIGRMTQAFSLSDEFVSAIPQNQVLQRVLNISAEDLQKVEDRHEHMLRHAIESGQDTLSELTVALIPILSSLLEGEGVNDRHQQVAIAQRNGGRLLTRYALAESEQAKFPFRLGSSEEAIENLTRLYEWRAEVGLGRLVRPYFDINQEGGVMTIVPAKEHPDFVTPSRPEFDIGCPITLMRQKIAHPVWTNGVTLAQQAGYYVSLQ